MESLGEYLRREREARHISLKQLSQITKISTANLTYLEDDRHDFLPASVFVKGFLRAYAKYLGLEEKEVIKRYQDYLNFKDKKGEEEALSPLPSPFPYRSLAIIGVLLVFILLLVYLNLNNLSSLYSPRSQREKIPPKSLDLKKEKKEEKAKELLEKPMVPKEEKELVLKVKTLEETWMRIQIDLNPPFEVTLKPGEIFTWKGKGGFKLRIGNAGGVELFLDDQPLGRPGESGEVIELSLPSKERKEGLG